MLRATSALPRPTAALGQARHARARPWTIDDFAGGGGQLGRQIDLAADARVAELERTEARALERAGQIREVELRVAEIGPAQVERDVGISVVAGVERDSTQ